MAFWSILHTATRVNFFKCKSDYVTSNKTHSKPCNSSPLLTRITWPTNLSIAWSTIQTSNWTTLALLPTPGTLGFIQFLSAHVVSHFWVFTQTIPLSGMLFPSSPLSIGLLTFVLSLQSSVQTRFPLVVKFSYSLGLLFSKAPISEFSWPKNRAGVRDTNSLRAAEN